MMNDLMFQTGIPIHIISRNPNLNPSICTCCQDRLNQYSQTFIFTWNMIWEQAFKPVAIKPMLIPYGASGAIEINQPPAS